MTEVMVFGANLSGFHGAGKAGDAFRGTKENNWRQDARFLVSLEHLNLKIAGKPYSETLLVGKRAVLGEIGLMTGHVGMSYGLVTTEAPGKQGLITSEVLAYELAKLFDCAKKHPNLNFVTQDFGRKRPHGYSWWEDAELQAIWDSVWNGLKFKPRNISCPPMFLVDKRIQPL